MPGGWLSREEIDPWLAEGLGQCQKVKKMQGFNFLTNSLHCPNISLYGQKAEIS